jgi:hypothetical protein
MKRSSLALVSVLSVTLAAAACQGVIDLPAAGPGTGSSTNTGAAGGGSTTSGSSAGTGGAGGGACVLSSLPLSLAWEGSTVAGAYVPVVHEGADAAFLVDTGSGLTFLREPVNGPDPVLDAGTVALGCETLSLIGRAEAAQMAAPNGLPVIGTLGVDQFLNGPTQLDFATQLLSFNVPGQPFDPGDAGATAPFDLVKGMVLAHATLDGTEVRLMFDTGSEDTLWLGAQPEPGDEEVQTTDALGNPVTLWLGTVTLGLGAYTAVVPVLRAPSFPYFAQTVADLGGNIQGLLGLSSMGTRVVIDPQAQSVEVTP